MPLIMTTGRCLSPLTRPRRTRTRRPATARRRSKPHLKLKPRLNLKLRSIKRQSNLRRDLKLSSSNTRRAHLPRLSKQASPQTFSPSLVRKNAPPSRLRSRSCDDRAQPSLIRSLSSQDRRRSSLAPTVSTLFRLLPPRIAGNPARAGLPSRSSTFSLKHQRPHAALVRFALALCLAAKRAPCSFGRRAIFKASRAMGL
ncbi:MAG: hypothetical protein QOF02_3711 [Blastocatellia bacterium]|nr:hypothetical protein [Blastocatellia bacterium]